MLTMTVRAYLRRDYGIRDIPCELLDYFVRKHRVAWPDDAATIAFVIANAWQAGLSRPAADQK